MARTDRRGRAAQCGQRLSLKQALRNWGKLHALGAWLAAKATRPTTITQPPSVTSPCTSNGCIVEALRPKQPAAATHQLARPVLRAGARLALEIGGLARRLRNA